MKSLETKYANLSKNDRLKLAQIMRRKRLEMGLTLEEMSDGICSTSYLSKIENCQVDVDDYYYNLLFEKLQIDYDEVVSTRLIPISYDILTAYLTNDLTGIEDYVAKTVVSGQYCDVENELFLFLYNVIKRNLSEAEMLVKKISLVDKVLSVNEQHFFCYVRTLYYLERGSFSLLDDSLKELLSLKIDDETLKVAVGDLLLDYYFLTNKAGSFYNAYQQFSALPLSLKFGRILYKHQLQSLVLRIDDDDVLARLTLLKSSAGKNLDLYHFYFVYYLIYYRKWQQAFDYLQEVKLNNKLLLLYAIVVDHLNNPNYFYQFLNVQMVKEEKYDCYFKDIIRYYVMKFQNFNHSYLLNYMRMTINDISGVFKNNMIFKIILKEYSSLTFELGRYKELVRFLAHQD